MFTRRQLASLLVTLVVLDATRILSCGQSDEPESLTKSKEIYSAKIDKIKKDVIASLDKRILIGRKKKNNKAIVDKLSKDRRDFENDINNLPWSLGKDWAKFFKRIKIARGELDKAYQDAISAYTSTGADVQATALKSEQEELQRKNVVQYQSPGEANVQQSDGAVQIDPALRVDPKILIESHWVFTRRRPEANQSGAFRIVDGVIYHLDTDNPVGNAALDPVGQLILNFKGHRKIADGTAIVEKVANGQFRGILVFLGDEWRFELSRR